MNQITNESGVFLVDHNGVLRDFQCAPDRYFYGKFIDLVIPEGVRALKENAFRGRAMTSVKFPESLEILGTGKGGAFSRCAIDVIILPHSMVLGPNAFSGSFIDRVIAPEKADPEMLRAVAHALRFAFSWDMWDSPVLKDWPQACVDIYEGKSEPEEAWRRLSNDTGSYWVDSDGFLMEYEPAPDNIAEPGGNFGVDVYRMRIPEGVTGLEKDVIAHACIHQELSFPESLKYIGHNVFSRCRLPDVVLPKNLEVLGSYAFGNGSMRSLTIPSGVSSIARARQFKDSHIGEIRMPVEFRDVIEEAVRNHYWSQGVTGELSDPQLGRLCYARADEYAKTSSDAVMYRLLGAVMARSG